jgi:hypothetical protein
VRHRGDLDVHEILDRHMREVRHLHLRKAGRRCRDRREQRRKEEQADPLRPRERSNSRDHACSKNCSMETSRVAASFARAIGAAEPSTMSAQ